jgi:hypothetical protein
VTFQQTQDGPPAAPIVLLDVDGGLTREALEDRLNTAGKPIVCYGALLVGGAACNVAAHR